MASKKTTAVVTGDKELDRKLRSLPTKLQKKVARSAMRKAGKRIQAAAKANLARNDSIDTGQLSKGIRVRAMKRSRNRIGIVISTTADRKDSSRIFGGMQVETGTKHVRAKPFLRPAGYDNEGEIRSMIVADTRDLIRELAKGVKV